MKIIDAHVHLGNTPKDKAPGIKRYPADQMREELNAVGASGAVVMAFPEDIYRSIDDPDWRNRTNEYVLAVAGQQTDVYPFYFVWRDYLLPDNLGRYAGIKWHRHAGEPGYDYNHPRCREFIREITRLKLPVLLEEEFSHTVNFIENNPELIVIIPHIGESNGGPDKMKVFFDNPNIFFDTAITDFNALKWALDSIGPERLIFGTDSSACRPHVDNSLPVAIRRHLQLAIDDKARELIFSGNIERLLSRWRSRQV